MSDYYEETYSVYDETWRKARKTHECCACKETIAAGQRYAHVAAIFDGVLTFKRCARCQEIHEHLREKCASDAYSGAMWPAERLDCGHEYVDKWGREPPPEIAALAFALPGEPPAETLAHLGVDAIEREIDAVAR
jgi:hypothetical protein